MYLCVLSSTPDDPNDTPYDPSAHMHGLNWKHHPVHPKNVEKQIRDLVVFIRTLAVPPFKGETSATK